MKISTELRSDDVYQFHVQWADRNRPWRHHIISFSWRFGLIVALLYFCLLPTLISAWRSLFMYACALSVLAWVFNVVVLVPFLASLVASDHGAYGRYEFEVTSDGFVESNIHGQQLIFWGAIKSVRELPDFLGLELMRTLFVVIPKAAFSSPEEMQNFHEKSRVGAGRATR